MGVYVQTMYMTMPAMVMFCFIFALIQHVAPLCLQWPLAQTFPVAWTGSTETVLSISFLDVYDTNIFTWQI
jgi:hypothetical protein